MEVLRHGTEYKEIQCSNCYAELAYLPKDIQEAAEYCEYLGVTHLHSKQYLICPECGYHITLLYEIDGEEC